MPSNPVKLQAMITSHQDFIKNLSSSSTPIDDVNLFWNLNIEYKADPSAPSPKNQRDYWQTPEETLLKGTGDCEDYAIAKFFDLKTLELEPWLGYGKDEDNQWHMVCLCEGRVLDNKYGDFIELLRFNMSEVRLSGRKLESNPFHLFPEWQRVIQAAAQAVGTGVG